MSETPLPPPEGTTPQTTDPLKDTSLLNTKQSEQPQAEGVKENGAKIEKNDTEEGQETQQREAYRLQLAESAREYLYDFSDRIFQNGSRIREDREVVLGSTRFLAEGESAINETSRTVRQEPASQDTDDISYFSRNMENSLNEALLAARKNYSPNTNTSEQEFLDWLRPLADDMKRGGVDVMVQGLQKAALEPDEAVRKKILESIHMEITSLSTTIIDSSQDFGKQNRRNGDGIIEQTGDALRQANGILNVTHYSRDIPDNVRRRLEDQVEYARAQVGKFNQGVEESLGNISFSYRQLEQAGVDLEKTMYEILNGILDPEQTNPAPKEIDIESDDKKTIDSPQESKEAPAQPS